MIRKGNAEPAIKDFNLVTGTGTDTTDAVLTARGFKLFVFMKELEGASPSRGDFPVILTIAKAKKIPVFFITGDYDNLLARAQQVGIAADITILKCDATAIKTAARVNPTLYLLKGGNILGKWSFADYSDAIGAVSQLQAQTVQ